MANTTLSSIVGDPVGTIREFVTAPSNNWVRCDGSVVSRSAYPALSAVLPNVPLPEVRNEGATQAAESRATFEINGITFFARTDSGPAFASYIRGLFDQPITAPNNPDALPWSAPVFRGNTMFLAGSDSTGNPRIGFANIDGTFANASIQNFLTGITPVTTQPGLSGTWFTIGTSNEAVFRTDDSRSFAFRGNTTPNTTNFVQVSQTVPTNRRNSVIVTSNVAIAVANTDTWLYKQPQFITWNRSVNTAIRVIKCNWLENNQFLLVANNANIYRATEAQILTGSLGTAVPFVPSANVNSIVTSGATVVVIGNGGLLGNSTDSGSTFTVRTSGTTNFIRCAALANATHGVAVGDGGVIRRTTDSGNTWVTVTSPVGANNFLQVTFTNGRFYVCYQAGSSIPALIESTDGSAWANTAGPRGPGPSMWPVAANIYIDAKRSSNSLMMYLDWPASKAFELTGTTWSPAVEMGLSSATADVSVNGGPTQVFAYNHAFQWCTDASLTNWEWTLNMPYSASRQMLKTVETPNGALFTVDIFHSGAASNGGRWTYTPNKLTWRRRTPSFPTMLVTPAGVVVAAVDRGVQATSAPGQLISSHIAASMDGGVTFGTGTFFPGERVMGLANDMEIIYKVANPANTTAAYMAYSTDYGTTWVPVQATSLLGQQSMATHFKQGDVLALLIGDSGAPQLTQVRTFNYDTATQMRLPKSTMAMTDASQPHIKVR